MNKINAIALIAGITTLLLIPVSYFIPWWQLTVGAGAVAPATINFSPLNFNVALFNSASMTVPIIWALNMVCVLSLLAGGLILMIYSFLPQKPYASKLLGYGYKQPLFAVALFVVEIVVLVLGIKAFTGVDFPFVGSGVISAPEGLIPGGVRFNVAVTAAFMWPFYLGIVVAVLSIAARLYHRKVANAPSTQLPPPPPPPEASLIS